jgi:hypothetical protein
VDAHLPQVTARAELSAGMPSLQASRDEQRLVQQQRRLLDAKLGGARRRVDDAKQQLKALKDRAADIDADIAGERCVCVQIGCSVPTMFWLTRRHREAHRAGVVRAATACRAGRTANTARRHTGVFSRAHCVC